MYRNRAFSLFIVVMVVLAGCAGAAMSPRTVVTPNRRSVSPAVSLLRGTTLASTDDSEYTVLVDEEASRATKRGRSLAERMLARR